MSESDSNPVLTVVVVMLGGPSHLRRWLEAMNEQVDAPPLEILIPYDGRYGDAAVADIPLPNARVLRMDRPGSYAQLRSLGVRNARGKYVMITEDHCLPRPDWCRTIVRMHDELPYAAIGGPMDKVGQDTVLNWTVYLQDFSRYMMPVPEGPTGYLTDCNVSYKVDRIAPIRDLWAEAFHETPVNWTLLDRGETLWLAPELAVGQKRQVTWSYAIRERYVFGRLFASTRVATVGRGKGLVYAALVAALPAILLYRVGRDVFAKKRAISRYVAGLPTLALLTTVWALGEFVGYLTGTATTEPHPAAS